MSTDNYGNEIATHDLDLEYVYPPKSERICAQDERFASVNEAIGLLQYNAEQDSERISDLLVRVEKLEAAQPIPQISRWPAAAHPPEGDWAHIPSSVWEDICAELEALRAKWASVPWEALRDCVSGAASVYAASGQSELVAWQWLADNEPKEAAE